MGEQAIVTSPFDRNQGGARTKGRKGGRAGEGRLAIVGVVEDQHRSVTELARMEAIELLEDTRIPGLETTAQPIAGPRRHTEAESERRQAVGHAERRSDH